MLLPIPRYLLAALILLLVACSDTPKTAEKQPFQTARGPDWPASLSANVPSGARLGPRRVAASNSEHQSAAGKGPQGKAGAWRVVFVSASAGPIQDLQPGRRWEGDLHEGVFGGTEENYTPRSDSTPFQVSAIRTDSDQAYETAAAKSADYIKKNPNKPVIFLMEQTRRFPDVTWRVIWGASVGTSDYSVFVDATTGEFFRKNALIRLSRFFLGISMRRGGRIRTTGISEAGFRRRLPARRLASS